MADRVTVIGWDGSPLTDAARAALRPATLVAGAAHHLALPEIPPHAERVRLGSVSLAARRIAAHRGTAVVLADGDPGYFGVVRALRAPEHGLEVEVVPAVSSVAAAFARAGMPWDDAQVVVAHERTLRRAVNVCRAHSKVAVLTAPGAGPAELALLLAGVHRTFVICEALGTSSERVTVLASEKAADHIWRDPNVVIVLGGSQPGSHTGIRQGSGWLAGRAPGRDAATGREVALRGWARPLASYLGARAAPPAGPTGGGGAPPPGVSGAAREGAPTVQGGPFTDSGAVPVAGAFPPAGSFRPGAADGAGTATPGPGESVSLRAAQLARIGADVGDLVWDIGCGHGALAAEVARFGAAVIAVDRRLERCAHAEGVARQLGVQLQVVHGTAPGVLEDLPEPDVVRVGGGGLRTLGACADRRPERIVTHATTRDEAEAAARLLGESGYRVECALLQSVELDTVEWTERERTVVFLLAATRG